LRTNPNDTPLGQANSAVPNSAADKDAPERRCILSGAHGQRSQLIRIALGPDGSVAPDLMARAPGRGAWIGVPRAALQAALDKGRLAGALARAFKTPIIPPADLADRIEAGFAKLLLDRMGLDMRSGALITGADKIDQSAREGRVALLLHAADAAEDGRRKRDQAWRVGQDAEGSGLCGTILPIERVRLSQALGRENAVHIALVDRQAAQRTGDLLERWRIFAEWDKEPRLMDLGISAALD
jgi:uncharacterized protein